MKVATFLNLFLLITVNSLQATIIGSDISVARQTRAFFKRVTSDSNKLQGFSVFEQGFVLENPSTIAKFDAFFPIRGDVVLNGGTLELLNDLSFSNPFRIGVGSIYGNGYSLGFPHNISYLDFPSIYYIKLIVNLIDSVNVGKDVYSVSWNYDDTYIALGLKASGVGAELQIYQFTGSAYSFVAQQDFGFDSINSLEWHPSSDYIAIALSGGAELQTWFFNRSTNQLSMVDSATIGNSRAVAWRPDGAYLAVGERSDSYIYLYPVTNGLLGSVILGSLGQTQEVLNSDLSWSSDGRYCAVGLKNNNFGELRIFKYDGNTFTQVSSASIGVNVNSVAWRPNSSLIALGLSSNTETLRMYQFNTTTNQLSELTQTRVGLKNQVLHAAWDSSGIYVAAAKEYAAQGYEVEIYYFDESDTSLHLVSGYSSDAYKRAVGWAHSGAYLATGDDNSMAYLFNFTNVPFVFKDLKLYFGSEVRGHADIHFQGNCTVNGSGNIFKLDASTNLIIDPNATLLLEDIQLKGIHGSNVRCIDNTGIIQLRNVTWVQDADFTFTQGAFEFIDDVTMKGDARFLYSSSQTSTIATKSQLALEYGFTFSYDPAITHTHLIEYADRSSVLVLNGATIESGKSGMAFLDGTLRVMRDSFLFSDPYKAIMIGNLDVSRDCYIDVYSGAHLRVMQGALHYKNADPLSWNQKSYDILHMEKDTELVLHSALNIGNGTFYFNKGALIYRLLGGDLIGKVHAEGPFTFEYER